jgi:hypothetical protein
MWSMNSTVHIELCHGFHSMQCLSCHPTCRFISVTACGCMISCVWEWWSIAWDCMSVFVSVWLLAGYTERFVLRKAPYTLSVKLSDFTVWHHTWWKNWVNCAVLTGNSADLRTVLSSFLSHRELHSSFRKSHSFLSLPADTMMASSHGTQTSNPVQIPPLTPNFTLSFLLFG